MSRRLPYRLREQITLKMFWAMVSGLPRQEARAHATREVIEEEREQRRQRQQPKQPGAASSDPLLAKLWGILVRHDEVQRRLADPRPHVLDTAPAGGEVARGVDAANVRITPAPASSGITGIWGSSSPTGGQRIPDSEYAPRFHDRSQYRASILFNEEVERSRKEHWQRRKAELKL